MPNGMPGVFLQPFFLIRETPPYRAMGGGAGEALVGEESYDPEFAGTGRSLLCGLHNPAGGCLGRLLALVPTSPKRRRGGVYS
jgi:hypothetical protein